MSQHEQWEWVDNYPNYSISASGEVRHRCWLSLRGNRMEVRGGHTLKVAKSKFGYLVATLYEHDGRKTCKRIMVHRLVAMAFIPNPENKPQVNHINGIKDDNRVENLEWVTRVENQQHAVRNGLYKNPKGEKHRMAKLNDQLVIDMINEYRNTKITQRELGDKYGIAQATVARIVKRKNWTHIKM